MYTLLSTYRHFKNFPNTEPATTKVGVIPNLLFELKLQEWRKRDLEIKEKIETKKQEIDKLPWKDCFDFEKVAIKELIDKTDGRFKIETYQEFLNRIQQPVFEQEIEQVRARVEAAGTIRRDSVFWSTDWDEAIVTTRRHPVFWSTVWDGGRYFFKNVRYDGSEYVAPYDHYVELAHVHKRNNAIFKTRLKYLSDTKTGEGNYENRGYYPYKSPKAYKQFLKQVEQKGLTRKAEVKKIEKEVYDPVDGVYHYNVSLLKRKMGSRDYKVGLDPDICYSFKDLNKSQKEKLEDEL